jgi:hypothetical protein
MRWTNWEEAGEIVMKFARDLQVRIFSDDVVRVISIAIEIRRCSQRRSQSHCARQIEIFARVGT